MIQQNRADHVPDPNCLAAAALVFLGEHRSGFMAASPRRGSIAWGLVSASLSAVGYRPITPSGYSLRNLSIDHWLSNAELSGLIRAPGAIRAGDVLLIVLDHGQFHLMIATGKDHVVHAHAGLRRVVLQPRDRNARIGAKWRLPPSVEG